MGQLAHPSASGLAAGIAQGGRGMSEIGIKDQCFGVEVEMTGITREQAAWALAEYFGRPACTLGRLR